jgi:DNA-binding MarR family transcriptional regulator
MKAPPTRSANSFGTFLTEVAKPMGGGRSRGVNRVLGALGDYPQNTDVPLFELLKATRTPLADLLAALEELQGAGLIERLETADGECLRLTPEGWVMSRSLAPEPAPRR